ncbi:hypothetical protein [Anaerorhabdus sp.]|uniref:hypothetical protein n=1 Tax=Anaerorhabdus sp. TaxID=1872524 RepID=UPI002FC74145
MKKIICIGLTLLLIGCSNDNKLIIDKLKKQEFTCEKNVCYLDSWVTGVYDSFDFNNDITWTTMIAQCDTLDFSGATFIINFSKETLTINENEDIYNCTFDPKTRKIKECSQNYENAQLVLDTLFTNLEQFSLTYQELK